MQDKFEYLKNLKSRYETMPAQEIKSLIIVYYQDLIVLENLKKLEREKGKYYRNTEKTRVEINKTIKSEVSNKDKLEKLLEVLRVYFGDITIGK